MPSLCRMYYDIYVIYEYKTIALRIVIILHESEGKEITVYRKHKFVGLVTRNRIIRTSTAYVQMKTSA